LLKNNIWLLSTIVSKKRKKKSMKWNTIPTAAELKTVADQMKERGFTVEIVEKKDDVLPLLKKIVPDGAAVMTGSSTSLHQVGVMDYLQDPKGAWKNIQATVWSEQDETKREALRRAATTSQYFLASVNAFTKSGELIAVDATGSRVSAYPFSAEHLILVVGAQKMVATIEDGMKRVREHVFPLEDERAQEAYGVHSTFGKWVIIEREVNPKRITVILVRETLGF
jgi:hypothetical protein